MQFSTSVLAGLVSLASLASGRIVGITVPKQVAAGQNFTAFLNTENYIQSIADQSVAFGMAPAAYAYPSDLGTDILAEKFLGPELSNVLKNISVPLTVPADFQRGEAVIRASLFSLMGARYNPVTTLFNVTVNVANVTDASAFVRSESFTSISYSACQQ